MEEQNMQSLTGEELEKVSGGWGSSFTKNDYPRQLWYPCRQCQHDSWLSTGYVPGTTMLVNCYCTFCEEQGKPRSRQYFHVEVYNSAPRANSF